MNRTMLRTLQIGLVVLILAALLLAGAVVLGMMSRAAAFDAAGNIALLVAIAVAAGWALVAVAGLGRGAGEDEHR